MATLQGALRVAGFVSEKQFRETEAVIQLQAGTETICHMQSAREKERRIGILRKTSSPDLFRREAKKLLLLDPDLVQEIINLAHMQGMHETKKKTKGGGRLIASLYQIRKELETSSDKRETVEKNFSKK